MRDLVTLLVFSILFGMSFGQDRLNIELLAHWKQDSLISNTSKVRYSDCYGFVWKGIEYAVIGSTEGTHIFEISVQNEFIPKGFIPGRFVSTSVSHRDYATYKNYLYAVCDEGVSSLQIIDFSHLPDSVHLIHEDSVQFGRVHNLFIDTNQALLYSLTHRSTVSTQTIEQPMKIFSLADPVYLQEVWSGPNDVDEVHDAYVRNGLAFLNCGYDGLRVYDFTNIASPLYLESLTFYQEQGYNHQGWLCPDGKTYLFADETNGKRIKKCVWNGSTLQIERYFGENYEQGSVPHNIMADNDFAYVAYYNEGLQIFDLRHPVPKRIAFYDTYPEENFFQMNGNWGVYSLLPSKRILAADRQYGLYLLGFDADFFRKAPITNEAVLFPNPVLHGEPLHIQFPADATAIRIIIHSVTGQEIARTNLLQATVFEQSYQLAAGAYYASTTFTDAFGTVRQETIPFLVVNP